MAYTDTLLASGERILRREHQHWFILVGNARYAILAIIAALAIVVLQLVTKQTGTMQTVLGYLTLALFVVGLAYLLWCWLRFQNEEYIISSRRIIHAQGVMNKKATDSSLEKINDAVLSESVWGRMFGFGDLDVLTASETGIERLRMLRDAKGFKRAMLEAKHELEIELTRPTMPPLRATEPVPPVAPPEPVEAEPPIAPSTTPEPAPSADVPAPAQAPATTHSEMRGNDVANALERLADLRDRGIVTPEEFEAKKRELLERL